MISELKTSTSLPYLILLSEDKDKNGWAIILPKDKCILVDPTNELMDYCSNYEILVIKYKDQPIDSPKIKFGKLKLYLGSYHQKIYLYVSKGEILFPLAVPKEYWPKLIKNLSVKLILTPDGQIQTPAEAYIYGLMH